jgi:phenylalanyl-tRNA synthetase alpha chain
MEPDKISQKLGLNEKKVLKALAERAEKSSIQELEKLTSLPHPATMRATLGLRDFGLIRIYEEKRELVSLTPEGKDYAQHGLPERRVVNLLLGGPKDLDTITGKTGLSREQVTLSIGWLRKKGWAEVTGKGENLILKLSEAGKKALEKKIPDEVVLVELLKKKKAVNESPGELRSAITTLKKRNLVELNERIERSLELTELGRKVSDQGLVLEEGVSQLTHNLLVSGKWREVKFKPYDVTAPGPVVYPGKLHPQQQVIEELREILLEMGFAEIESKLVESEFWNFDALFQPQDHPAREIHDSLSVSIPKATKLPSPALVKRVIAAHEKGVAGSSGWGYKFNTDISRRPVLCSQTTAATVRYLASHPDPPAKIFSIGRVYRHDKIDYKHLAEFYQCEGIVMNPKLTLRDMLGYLKQIIVKLGFPKIRFSCGFFPYTEPSVEAYVWHQEKHEWLEILGAGMFRPELLQPLGINYPTLAWGIGFSRLVMLRLGLKDIRDLFSNDIEWLSSYIYPVSRG